MPVFGTMAARFNDDGVTALYQAVLPALVGKGLKVAKSKLPVVKVRPRPGRAIVPADRTATSPRSPTPCAATTSTSSSRPASRASASR
jgi:hypothetical protein